MATHSASQSALMPPPLSLVPSRLARRRCRLPFAITKSGVKCSELRLDCFASAMPTAASSKGARKCGGAAVDCHVNAEPDVRACHQMASLLLMVAAPPVEYRAYAKRWSVSPDNSGWPRDVGITYEPIRKYLRNMCER
eukprot:scaffold23659_cov36-Tisochrysis_lutea.AAC.4